MSSDPKGLILRDCNVLDTDFNGRFVIQKDAEIAIKKGVIEAVGPRGSLVGASMDYEVLSCDSAWVTPGLIDCHTHLVYGGNRIDEYQARLGGGSYLSMNEAGGGIYQTVESTRAASHGELLKLAKIRLRQMARNGTTSLEIKSGYGLDLASEAKMLRVARELDGFLGISVKTTFLGAHVVPKEFLNRGDEYVDYLVEEVLPELNSLGLIDAVDGFCETIAFSPEQLKTLYGRAQSLGIAIKGHVEQLSNSSGASVLASFDALSADHLEYVDEKGIQDLAKRGVVAVLLPGAYYFLSEKTRPPVEVMRMHSLEMAIATDANPGTSPLYSLLLAMNMATVLFGLSPQEALRGTTANAAKALGYRDRGRIEAGLRADLCVWQIDHPAELSYYLGLSPLIYRITDGVVRDAQADE